MMHKGVWRVFGSGGAETGMAEMKMKKLYATAIQGREELTDMSFVGDDWEMRAHRWVVSAGCEFLWACFTNGMQESTTGRVRVPDCSKQSFAALLSFLYTGEVCETVRESADGFELWDLGLLWGVTGLREWLQKEQINSEILFPILQYGIERADNDLVQAAVQESFSMPLHAFSKEHLRSIASQAVVEVLRAHPEGRSECGFLVIMCWWEANGSASEAEAHFLAQQIDLYGMDSYKLATVVGDSWLYPKGHVRALLRDRTGGGVGWGRHTLFEACEFEKGSVSGGPSIQDPRHLCGLHDGGLCVADENKHCVLVFGANGIFERALGGLGAELGQFQHPDGVAASGDLIFVTDQGLNRVTVFRRGGDLVRVFGSNGMGQGQMRCPGAIAVNSCGEIFVCDQGNFRVLVFNKEGTVLRAFGSGGEVEGCFQYMCGLAISPKDNAVIVTDHQLSGVGRAQMFSRDGTFIRVVGASCCLCPLGVAFSPGGDIVVAEHASDLIIFTVDGVPLQHIPIASPFGVAVGVDGRIFMSDQENGCVTVLEPVDFPFTVEADQSHMLESL